MERGPAAHGVPPPKLPLHSSHLMRTTFALRGSTLGTGAASEVGKGAGLGKTVNIAGSGTNYSDAEYLAAFDRIVMPIARQFAPELVIVSAGERGAAVFVGPLCQTMRP